MNLSESGSDPSSRDQRDQCIVAALGAAVFSGWILTMLHP